LISRPSGAAGRKTTAMPAVNTPVVMPLPLPRFFCGV
jgi:hypothetical protein